MKLFCILYQSHKCFSADDCSKFGKKQKKTVPAEYKRIAAFLRSQSRIGFVGVSTGLSTGLYVVVVSRFGW
jgi:hypothetical protein